jgi:hypothetical protein
MKKTDYIQLTIPETCAMDLSTSEVNKRMEEAWKELRTKTLELGKPFLVTEDSAELPSGEIIPLSEILAQAKA